jgi:hypothetical protein
MRVLGYHKEEQEEQEESENRLCIRFPLHPTLSHLLNLVYLLVDGLFPVPSISPSLEEWPVVSEAEGSELAVCEKRQNKANCSRVLVIGTLKLTTNEDGIGQENKPNARSAASREGRQQVRR